MKKQIIYSSFISRLFAALIDVSIFSFLTSPINHLLSKKIFAWYFGDYLTQNNISLNDYKAISQHFIKLNSLNEMDQDVISVFASYSFTVLAYNFLIIGICYIVCWYKWENTIGKSILKLKIVDENSLNSPTKTQFFQRYLGYVFAFLNILIMPFDKKSRGTQDLISGTIVVKA